MFRILKLPLILKIYKENTSKVGFRHMLEISIRERGMKMKGAGHKNKIIKKEKKKNLSGNK